jgi:hypothetical protein
VAEGIREMSGVNYLSWFVLAVGGAFGSARMLVVAERGGAYAQAWLAASTFVLLWSALAALCFWESA